jgi:cytochrome c-type biogenesis protein CcmH/NrfG
VTTPNASDTPPVEAALPTATIIPFPARPKPAQPAPQERLARALESLNAALADQKIAIAAWRDVLGELKATTTGLDDSLRHYRTTLRTLGNSVNSLHAKARSLEQWADGVAAAE